MKTPRPTPVLLVIACGLGGCDLGLRPGAATIQEALIPVGSTPGEQAVMATNAYDPNDRYLGTLGLAGQDFAGEPLYINHQSLRNQYQGR
jgi:hypothetical protein